eukprot:9322435-Ditylum_brightwellii.AAC.1
MYMVTNPPDKPDKGSQIISNDEETEKVELVFEEGAEGEKIDFGLGFDVGVNPEGNIEAPEPGFAPLKKIPCLEVKKEKQMHLVLLLMFTIEVILKKEDQEGGLDAKSLRKLRESAEVPLDTKFD